MKHVRQREETPAFMSKDNRRLNREKKLKRDKQDKQQREWSRWR